MEARLSRDAPAVLGNVGSSEDVKAGALYASDHLRIRRADVVLAIFHAGGHRQTFAAGADILEKVGDAGEYAVASRCGRARPRAVERPDHDGIQLRIEHFD